MQQPVVERPTYQFKIERTDGKTVRWSVNGVDYFPATDPAPLAGQGHDHFGLQRLGGQGLFRQREGRRRCRTYSLYASQWSP